MTINISKNTQQWIKAGVLSLLLTAPSLVLAAGGLDAAKGQVESYKTEIMAIIGICAGVFLLAKVVMVGFFEKGDWIDVGKTAMYILIAGGAYQLATTFWKAGGGA
jgi:hypothetical protein